MRTDDGVDDVSASLDDVQLGLHRLIGAVWFIGLILIALLTVLVFRVH